MKLTKTHVYIFGSLLLTAAAANSLDITAGLLTAGFLCLLYSFFVVLGEAE